MSDELFERPCPQARGIFAAGNIQLEGRAHYGGFNRASRLQTGGDRIAAPQPAVGGRSHGYSAIQFGDRPDEAGQFAGDRRGDDGRRLPSPGKFTIPPAKPFLSFPCCVADRFGEVLLA